MKKLIEFPDEIKKDLESKAAKSGISLTAYIRMLLINHVNRTKK